MLGIKLGRLSFAALSLGWLLGAGEAQAIRLKLVTTLSCTEDEVSAVPFGGVTVRFQPLPDQNAPELVFRTPTADETAPGDEGLLRVEVPVGEYAISLAHPDSYPGFIRIRRTAHLGQGQTFPAFAPLDVVLDKTSPEVLSDYEIGIRMLACGDPPGEVLFRVITTEPGVTVEPADGGGSLPAFVGQELRRNDRVVVGRCVPDPASPIDCAIPDPQATLGHYPGAGDPDYFVTLYHDSQVTIGRRTKGNVDSGVSVGVLVMRVIKGAVQLLSDNKPTTDPLEVTVTGTITGITDKTPKKSRSASSVLRPMAETEGFDATLSTDGERDTISVRRGVALVTPFSGAPPLELQAGQQVEATAQAISPVSRTLGADVSCDPTRASAPAADKKFVLKMRCTNAGTAKETVSVASVSPSACTLLRPVSKILKPGKTKTVKLKIRCSAAGIQAAVAPNGGLVDAGTGSGGGKPLRLRFATRFSADPNATDSIVVFNLPISVNGSALTTNADGIVTTEVAPGPVTVRVSADVLVDAEGTYRVGFVAVDPTKKSLPSRRCAPTSREGDVTFALAAEERSAKASVDHEVEIRIVPELAPADAQGAVSCAP